MTKWVNFFTIIILFKFEKINFETIENNTHDDMCLQLDKIISN